MDATASSTVGALPAPAVGLKSSPLILGFQSTAIKFCSATKIILASTTMMKLASRFLQHMSRMTLLQDARILSGTQRAQLSSCEGGNVLEWPFIST